MNKINNIQVLGSGCPSCKKLFELTKQAVNELSVNTEVEYVTDIQKIIELGVMSSPVLTINGKVVLVGQLPGLDKIKEIISASNRENVNQPAGGCSCGGEC
jgi:small redox-active disulfide protein 2